MPENWIQEVVGDEARARTGFEDELARELHREWQGRGRHTPSARTKWRAIAWGAAAAAVLVGGIALIAKDENKQIAPATTLPEVVTTEPAPTVTESPTTTPDTTPETTETTNPPSTTSTTLVDTTGLTGVELYLASLNNGDYDTAARLLNEGGLSLEDRADIRPLFRPEFGLIAGQTDRAAVAAALQLWCGQANCFQPLEIALVDDRWVRATFAEGTGTLSTLFTEYTFEGQEGVTGLPPMLPPGGMTATTTVIDCPTDSVDRVTWADLDGDGWIEQVVGQVGSQVGGEGGPFEYKISVCGTALQIAPLDIVGDGLAIYPVNPGFDGADTVLIGFTEGVPNGGVYTFDGQAIVPQQGFDGPATFAFAPPYAADPAETFGCAVLVDGQPPVLANRTYRLIGGNELSNSTSMELTTVDILTGFSVESTFDLPEQQAEAGEALIGYCNGLPVQVF